MAKDSLKEKIIKHEKEEIRNRKAADKEDKKMIKQAKSLKKGCK